MSHRWDAPLATAVADGGDTGRENSPSLPAPTVFHGPGSGDDTITYGLVARVALNRPGFGFRIEHDLPPGVDLVSAKPRATVVGEHLIWQIGRVDPGQELRLEIVVRPQPGTELKPDDIATFTGTYSQNLYFQAPVVRSRLTARLSGPAKIEPGDFAEFVLDVVNIGSFVANDVLATVTLPPEFDHPDGPAFSFNLGSIKRGEYCRVTVPAEAVRLGQPIVRATVAGADGREAIVEFTTRVAGS
jgi:hypothetical protein